MADIIFLGKTLLSHSHRHDSDTVYGNGSTMSPRMPIHTTEVHDPMDDFLALNRVWGVPVHSTFSFVPMTCFWCFGDFRKWVRDNLKDDLYVTFDPNGLRITVFSLDRDDMGEVMSRASQPRAGTNFNLPGAGHLSGEIRSWCQTNLAGKIYHQQMGVDLRVTIELPDDALLFKIHWQDNPIQVETA